MLSSIQLAGFFKLLYLKKEVKKWMMKFIFVMQINIEAFCKLIRSFWMYLTEHSQITQCNKFAITLQYLKKEISDEVDFLHVDKHENLLQIDTVISVGMVKQCLYNASKKNFEMKSIFYIQINTNVSYKLTSTLWASKFPTR